MHKVVFDVLVEKFYKDLPKLKIDWERYKDKFDSIKNWSQFDSMTDETLERNYMDQNVINKLRKMVNEPDLTSLSKQMIEYFPELEEQLKGTIPEIKESIPELEKEISDLTFIRRIEPQHRQIIREIYDTGDMISMHKKFLADFPDDKMLQREISLCIGIKMQMTFIISTRKDTYLDNTRLYMMKQSGGQ